MELENLVANSLLLKARLGGCPADPAGGGGTGRGFADPRFTGRGLWVSAGVRVPPRVASQAAQDPEPDAASPGQVSAEGAPPAG